MLEDIAYCLGVFSMAFFLGATGLLGNLANGVVKETR